MDTELSILIAHYQDKPGGSRDPNGSKSSGSKSTGSEKKEEIKNAQNDAKGQKPGCVK